MTARKRTRASTKGDGKQPAETTPQPTSESAGDGGDGGERQGGRPNRDRSRRRNQRNRRRKSGNRTPTPKQPGRGAGFWGVAEELPEPSTTVRVSDDPAAVARSLGTPHLPGHEKAAEHYFAVVYERAVQIAAAVAAAGGLIAPDELTED